MTNLLVDRRGHLSHGSGRDVGFTLLSGSLLQCRWKADEEYALLNALEKRDDFQA
ncbi:hypothetical protein ACVBEG_27575 [Pseudomonas sp. GG8]